MISISEYAYPESLDQAYEILMKNRSNALIGGCAFLRMGSKKIKTAVDISRLGLDKIEEDGDCISIGAMVTLRQLETSEVLKKSFGNLISDSVRNILGVQFRNMATIGATVFSRYGFSDPITALLALDTNVELYNGGRMSLEEFISGGPRRDILIRIVIRKSCSFASFQMIRNSMADYAIINAAVSTGDYGFRISVGARPYAASLAKGAMQILNSSNDVISDIDRACQAAAQELSFSTNIRASKEYREAVCPVILKRALLEVVNNG